MKYLIALLAYACFGHGNYLPELDAAPGISVKRIQGSDALLRTAWEQSPWSRPTDLVVGVVFFVVAEDGTACVVPDKMWAVVKPGDRIHCTPWRMPR